MRLLLLLLTFGVIWMACSEFTVAPSDASVEAPGDAATDAASAPCRIMPISAFAYAGTPRDDAASPQAVACNLENAVILDGKLAGLDRAPSGGKATINGIDVAGCVGVQFGDDVQLDEVTLVVAPVADACGASPCVQGDLDAGCGSSAGLQLAVFSGATADAALSGYEQKRYDAQPESLTLGYRVVPGAHVVVVCRGGVIAVTRDDVGVDAIWANCSR